VHAATNAALASLNFLADYPINEVDQSISASMDQTHERIVCQVGTRESSIVKELWKFANKPLDLMGLVV
jgi:hypothetical protein